jgi:hypothetical protein
MAAIAVAAAGARWAVYGLGSVQSGSPLQGYVLFSAFTGGVALAFSLPFLLVVVPCLTVLSLRRPTEVGSSAFGERVNWGPLEFYLAVFAPAFVVTISGFPTALATPIYRSEWLIDPTGGALFLFWGGGVVMGLLPGEPGRSPSPVWRRVVSQGPAGVLGASTGALMYHELDPAYDSVFFFTANAVAASHAPLTVAVFTIGLGLTYMAAGSVATAVASRARWGLMVLLVGRILSGIATVTIGLLVLTDRFGAIRGLLY